MIHRIGNLEESKRVVQTVLIPGDGTTIWNNTGAITTGLGFVTPTSTTGGYNKGASFGTVPANKDFILKMDVTSTISTYAYKRNGMFGLGEVGSDVDGGYTSISATIALQLYVAAATDRRIHVWVNGSVTTISTGTIGFVYGDTFEIHRVGGVFKYYHNSTLIHTTTYTNNNALIFDCSITEYLGMNNISITY